MRNIRCGLVFAIAAAGAASASAQPTTTDLQQVLTAQLQKLKSTENTVRTVLFQTVRPGRANGSFYPFEVTATIHDYNPGYPPNKYYGQTCVGQMNAWKFDMLRNDFGDWIVQGRMTVSDAVCKDNPSEGVSVVPVGSLQGTRAPAGSPRGGTATASASLYVGEYACYGAGGRLMAGMGFRLSGGKYADLDGKRGGTYTYNAAIATIAFRSGYLDGQTGINVTARGFQISPTVTCEPWR